MEKNIKERAFTGLSNKNGEKIHEGDILDIEIDAPVEVFWNADCGWLVAGGWLSGDGLEYYNERAIIIGNKYDNPELMQINVDK